jgi:hypothetical protein
VALDLVIKERRATAATVGAIRRYSALGIGDIMARVASGEPVVTVSTEDGPPEADLLEGRHRQHQLLLKAREALTELGHAVLIRYRPCPDEAPEAVELAVARNLMMSELQHLRQRHD